MTQAPRARVFEIPWTVKSSDVLKALPAPFNAAAPAAERSRLTYYDTFDWRLYRRGLSLVRTGEAYQLRRIDDITVLESAPDQGSPRFWWDFPAGGLKNRLRVLIEERAVMRVGEVGLRSRTSRILNIDKKTVARVVIQIGEAFSDGRTAARIRLLNIIPLRGYTKDAARLSRHLAGKGLQPARSGVFAVAVVACGREPGDYTSKLDIQLDPNVGGRRAAGLIFEHLLDTMRRNVDGIRKDIDTEFLHDFRVAVRRTRSGLSQLKAVLPAEVVARFGEGFAEFGRSTNRLRDLDVYLLDRDRYREMLAPDLRAGLDPLFDRLAAERSAHHEAVVRVINGQRYREIVGEWRKTLRTFAEPVPPSDPAAVPAGELARTVIRKRYRRVIKNGRVIDSDTADSALHSLRIDCKKLRYMLEFFASLYPPELIGGFIKQLKRLQDNLGAFNDLSVQQSELRAFLEDWAEGAPTRTAAAVGALIAKLESRQHEVRGQFAAAFDQFAGPDNEKCFAKLLKS